MSEAEEREAFEAWMSDGGRWLSAVERSLVDGQYKLAQTASAWSAWGAAWAARSQGWRPISEAPRDGTDILAFKPKIGLVIVRHLDPDHPDCQGDDFHESWNHSYCEGLTRWMPLPERILEQATYKPGDQAPEGYLAWHEWAEVQHKAGLRQKQCGKCGLWRYPQELSGETVRWTGVTTRGKKVTSMAPVCLKCGRLTPDTTE